MYHIWIRINDVSGIITEEKRREYNNMTKKALQFLVKILFYIFVVLLLVYLFVQTRQFGYLVFADQAKDRP